MKSLRIAITAFGVALLALTPTLFTFSQQRATAVRGQSDQKINPDLPNRGGREVVRNNTEGERPELAPDLTQKQVSATCTRAAARCSLRGGLGHKVAKRDLLGIISWDFESFEECLDRIAPGCRKELELDE